jgi:AcrR family transcriptional regulator
MPSRASVAARGTQGARLVDIQRSRLIEIQRSRLIAGAVCAIEELGYAQVTVGHVTRRASVSRRTFYALFANCEDCLAEVLEGFVGQIGDELAAAKIDDLPWRERVHTGLWVILSLLDHEPALARICMVQALRGGPRVLRRREEILSGLATVIDEGRNEGHRGGECTPLTAEGVVGAVVAIVYARLLRGERTPLVGLLGELTGMIVLPYLGPAAARREQTRPAPARSRAARPQSACGMQSTGDPLRGVPVRLTYRTARVLEGVAEHPGASNRTVGEHAGVADPGQISKLLARLERAGLLANTGLGHSMGEPNAWTLTPQGQQVAQSIRVYAPHRREAA